MKIFLEAHPPFSLAQVVWSHGWAQLAPFATEDRSGKFSYVFHLSSGKTGEMTIHEIESGVSVEVDDSLSQSEVWEISQNVKWMLGLDQDLSEFYLAARNEPSLAHVEERRQGRILRSPTLFEDVIKTILTTNTLWAATIRMNKNVVDQFGSALAKDPSRHAFPNPEQLAMTSIEILRSSTRLGYRAPYILELAKRVASGDLDLEAYKTTDLPTPELRKHLLGIKGVGSYAAANLLMILGRYDYLPVDSWAMRMVSQEWYQGEPIGRAEVENAFERWGKWKGLAYWFWNWSSN